MMPLGELAALGTATCWSVTSLAFAEASRRVGPLRVNLLRLPMAFMLLSAGLAFGGSPFADLNGRRLGILAVSGIIGLVVGDLAFFAALRRLGARTTSLLMALAPLFAAAGGAALLDELPKMVGALGVSVTLAGVWWVVAERPDRSRPQTLDRHGVLLGVSGAACQGIGLVLAKIGMAGVVAPLTATWVRIGVATGVIWLLTALAGRARTVQVHHSLRGAGAFIAAGAFFGPFLGVWLSLVAARLTDVGVAATIMATSPVLVIPLVMVTERYRPTYRAVFGTVLAVVGVALLFSR